MNLFKKNNKLKFLSKSFILTALFIASNFISQAQNKTTDKTINVTVKNIKNTNGKVFLSLHNEASFMKGKGIEMIETEIQSDTVKVTFKAILPGEYAIMVVHDENENKQMDFYGNGMPKESYGMSNNPILYGPPTFEVAKFEIKKDNKEIVIRL